MSLAIITEVRTGTASSHGTESLSREYHHRGEEGQDPGVTVALVFPTLASPLCMWQLTVSSPPPRMPSTASVRGLPFHSQRTWELPENMGAAEVHSLHRWQARGRDGATSTGQCPRGKALSMFR